MVQTELWFQTNGLGPTKTGRALSWQLVNGRAPGAARDAGIFGRKRSTPGLALRLTFHRRLFEIFNSHKNRTQNRLAELGRGSSVTSIGAEQIWGNTGRLGEIPQRVPDGTRPWPPARGLRRMFGRDPPRKNYVRPRFHRRGTRPLDINLHHPEGLGGRNLSNYLDLPWDPSPGGVRRSIFGAQKWRRNNQSKTIRRQARGPPAPGKAISFRVFARVKKYPRGKRGTMIRQRGTIRLAFGAVVRPVWGPLAVEGPA